MKITKAMTRGLGRASLKIKAYSPELLLGLGIGSLIGSTVLACNATLKVDGILDIMSEEKEKLNKVKDMAEKGELDEGVIYTERDYSKDMLTVRVQSGVELLKVYSPAIVMGAFGVGCILTSHNIIKVRQLAALSALAITEESFDKYRGRVAEQLGADKEEAIFHGKTTIFEGDSIIIDEKGKEKIVKGGASEAYTDSCSPYSKFFDETCFDWKRDADHNLTFLLHTQDYANKMLHAKGHIFLNEVYDMIGIKRTSAGQIVGWVYNSENGDGHIDFGIFNKQNAQFSDANRLFVNGYEQSVLLDFNVDGVIYDLIGEVR